MFLPTIPAITTRYYRNIEGKTDNTKARVLTFYNIIQTRINYIYI